MFGLSEKIYEQIINILKKYNFIFLIFGSRARGDYKLNSDIDIAVIGNVDEKKEYEIRNDFDMLDIPYTIDLVFIRNCIKKELKESIEREGVELYNGKI